MAHTDENRFHNLTFAKKQIVCMSFELKCRRMFNGIYSLTHFDSVRSSSAFSIWYLCVGVCVYAKERQWANLKFEISLFVLQINCFYVRYSANESSNNTAAFKLRQTERESNNVNLYVVRCARNLRSSEGKKAKCVRGNAKKAREIGPKGRHKKHEIESIFLFIFVNLCKFSILVMLANDKLR